MFPLQTPPSYSTEFQIQIIYFGTGTTSLDWMISFRVEARSRNYGRERTWWNLDVAQFIHLLIYHLFL